MIYCLAILAGLYLLFIALPAVFIVMGLTSHQNVKDFDQRPDELDGTPYEPFKEQLVSAIVRLKEQPCETVSIRAQDGTRLSGRWYQRGDRAIIMGHGYHSTPFNNYARTAMAFMDEGWSVLLPDMRGHGSSGGHTAMGLREGGDMIEWAGWVSRREDCRHVVLYGISMSGSALTFAAPGPWPEKTRALIIESAYARIEDQMRALNRMRWIPRGPMIPVIRVFAGIYLKVETRQDGLMTIKNSALPVFFVAGGRDETVSASVVRRTYESCGSRKEFYEVDNAPHTLAFTVGEGELKPRIFRFLEKTIDKE